MDSYDTPAYRDWIAVSTATHHIKTNYRLVLYMLCLQHMSFCASELARPTDMIVQSRDEQGRTGWKQRWDKQRTGRKYVPAVWRGQFRQAMLPTCVLIFFFCCQLQIRSQCISNGKPG